jgi:large subunit ribosomal protein L33
MASKKKPYVKLQCAGCKKINYFAHKSKGAEGKLELSKFCKTERKHTKHKEAKK